LLPRALRPFERCILVLTWCARTGVRQTAHAAAAGELEGLGSRSGKDAGLESLVSHPCDNKQERRKDGPPQFIRELTVELAYSDHTARTLHHGVGKWKRRPPGNSNVGTTIAPPSADDCGFRGFSRPE